MFRWGVLVPATYWIEFSWFEFVGHEAGTKWPRSIFNAATCALFWQTVPATHFLCLSLFRVQQLAYCPWNMRSVRSHKGACPLFMSPEHSDTTSLLSRRPSNAISPYMNASTSLLADLSKCELVLIDSLITKYFCLIFYPSLLNTHSRSIS